MENSPSYSPWNVELYKIKEKLNLLQPTIETTRDIFLRAKENGFLKGRSGPTLLGAALYMACRLTRTPMTLKDISCMLSLKRTLVARQYRTLVSKLNLDIPSVDISKCIIRLVNMTSISERTKHVAMHILNEISRREAFAGKKPMAVAAAILYMSCEITGEHKSQNVIAQVAGITPVTLKTTYLIYKKQLPLLQGSSRNHMKISSLLY
jgi:transcription initiation factor TFIIB